MEDELFLIVGLYFEPSRLENIQSVTMGITLLSVAALFQIGDGVQTIASSCLRALKDTKIPMLMATLGYWGIGFPLGHYFALSMSLGAKGMWLGLAVGLSSAAVMLTTRFLILSHQYGHQKNPGAKPPSAGLLILT